MELFRTKTKTLTNTQCQNMFYPIIQLGVEALSDITYIHTYIHTLLLPPQWGFSGTITKITKLLITTESKLIKLKKHLQHVT